LQKRLQELGDAALPVGGRRLGGGADAGVVGGGGGSDVLLNELNQEVEDSTSARWEAMQKPSTSGTPRR